MTVDGRNQRAARTREAVLEHAARLFAAKGFEATGVDEIAAAAGVSKGTVFYGFSSKEGVFSQVLAQAAGRLAADLIEARAGRDGWAALKAQAWAVLSCVDASPEVGTLLTREVLGPGERWPEERRAARELVIGPLVKTITELRESRADTHELARVEPGMDDVTAVALLGALVFAALDRRTYQPDRTLAQIHTRLLAVIVGLSLS